MTPPEIRLAALCDHALVGQDGKVSLLGIFRNISVSGLPAQHPRMFLVAILGLDVGADNVIVRPLPPARQPSIRSPPGNRVPAAAAPASCSPGARRSNRAIRP